MKFTKQTLTWLIIIYMLTILALSVALINTKVALNRTWVLHVRLDQLLHALLFLPWMVLIHWRWKEKRSVIFYLLALASGLVLASISEMVQLLVPLRTFNIVDLMANSLGIVVGALIAGWGGAKRQLRQGTM